MIKASDIGLTKQELDEIEEFGKAREQFIDDMCAKANVWAFEQLNVPKEHTPEELTALMLYKGENIKAHVIPPIFFEVAELLKKQQEELQEYRNKELANTIYTEEDL